MKVFAVIPARGGSKGIPRKNLSLVGGKPLIQHTIESALDCSKIEKLVVSTEDEEIGNVCASLGVDLVKRPAELSQDRTPTYPVVEHALRDVEATTKSTYDAVLLLQPTTPFRSRSDIDTSIKTLEESDADSVVSVVDVGANHPARMKVMEDGLLRNFTGTSFEDMRPRQELNQVFIRNGAIYLTTRKSFFESSSLVGARCLPFVMPAERSINIDTEMDLVLADLLMGRKGDSK